MAKNISNYTLHLSLSGLGITLREFLAKFNYFKGFHKAILEKNFFCITSFLIVHMKQDISHKTFFYHVVQGIWVLVVRSFQKDKRTSISLNLAQIKSILYFKTLSPSNIKDWANFVG